MARKRLNKKVAIIGSMVFLIFVLAVIVAFLRYGQDPDEFIKNGDKAWLAKDFEGAQRNFLKAYRFAKTSSLRKDILFRLLDIYIETSQWPKVRGCWEQIINIDPKNVNARLGRLKYLYIVADSYASSGRNISGVWKEVQSQTSELIKLIEDESLLRAERTGWEPSFGIEEKQLQQTASRQIGPYLYLLKGRAAFELAQMGAVTVPDELLAQAVGDLEMVLRLDPNNVNAYWYLAQSAIEKGKILAARGSLEEKGKAAGKAGELLQQAIKVADRDPRAHINLLTYRFTLAREGEPKLVKQQLKSLEADYLSLMSRFPSCAEAFAAISKFYSVSSIYSDRNLSRENLDKAAEAAGKAIELDKENVTYALIAAELCYRRYSIYGQKTEIQKAEEIAKNALVFADVRDTLGPRSALNKMNRFLLCSFLANCYVEQVLEPAEGTTKSQIEGWVKEAEKMVHEIEQIFGSSEEPQVVKWQGMLELAKGNTELAANKLYAAYEQIKASNPPEQRDAQLAYTLSKIYQRTYEVGAVAEFLIGAIDAGIEMVKPEAILDYLEVLGRLDMWSPVLSSVYPYNIDAFEQKYGPNKRSQTLRIKALIGTNRISEAEEALARLDKNDPDIIKLNLVLVEEKISQIRAAIVQKRAAKEPGLVSKPAQMEENEEVSLDPSVKLMTVELNNHRQFRAELINRMLATEPNWVDEDSVISICKSYIAQGQIDKAKDLVSLFLKYFPNNTSVLLYKQLLCESDPKNVSPQRRREIEKQVILSLTDPLSRAVKLGIYYRNNNETDKAVEELKKALEMPPPQAEQTIRPAFNLSEEAGPRRLAASFLFNIANETKDWKLAEKIVEDARSENLDDCQGRLFAARLNIAKNDFKSALAEADECLKQKPLLSRAFVLRSNINALLGNDNVSIEDIRKAASLNPLDGAIAARMAGALLLRDQKLGDNALSEQKIETRRALERAIRLNPGDLSLLSDYAEYISSTDPSKALAIRQSLQENAPSLLNAVLLGKLAIRMALNETDAAKKGVLFEIAASSLEQAKKIDPHDKAMLECYAEYYRARGQQEKAQQLLMESKDQSLLWRHYFQLGQFEDAKKILDQLYQRQPKDADVLKGLLLVAEETADTRAISKYSEELLSLEDNVEYRLEQIRAFLSVGFIEEAKHKLQSFKEKYPNETRILLLEGWLAMRQGQLEKALELTNRSLETNQDDAGAWRLKGQINFLMANYNQAILDFQRSRSLLDTPTLRISLAKAYLQADRADDAITELKNAIDNQGAPMQARELLEQVYLILGRKDALKKFYDDTLAKFPADVPWYNRAAAFAIACGEFDRAEQLYKKAYQLKSEEYHGQNSDKAMQDAQYAAAFDGYLQALVLAAGQQNTANSVWRPQKLDVVFQEAKKHEDTAFAPLALYWMGEAKLKLGDKTAAIEYCRRAVDKAATNEALATEILFRMCSSLGTEEVSKYCEQRLITNPDSLSANFTMFDLARIQDNYTKAKEYIDKCIKLTDADSPRRQEYLMRKAELLTQAYEKTSDNNYLKEAIADYESLLAKMPNNTNVLNNLAYMLAESNQRLTEALEYARKAFEQKKDNPSFMDTYAYVLYKNGQDLKAAELLTAAVQQCRQSVINATPQILEHLGMVKEKLGEKEHALVAYRQALQAGGDKLPGAAKQRIQSAIERLSGIGN